MAIWPILGFHQGKHCNHWFSWESCLFTSQKSRDHLQTLVFFPGKSDKFFPLGEKKWNQKLILVASAWPTCRGLVFSRPMGDEEPYFFRLLKLQGTVRKLQGTLWSGCSQIAPPPKKKWRNVVKSYRDGHNGVITYFLWYLYLLGIQLQTERGKCVIVIFWRQIDGISGSKPLSNWDANLQGLYFDWLSSIFVPVCSHGDGW